jgi:hypothetical protein
MACWKSRTTCGLPVFCWITPMVIFPLLIPGPVHDVLVAAPLVPVPPVALLELEALLLLLFLLLLHAAATIAKTTAAIANFLVSRTVSP